MIKDFINNLKYKIFYEGLFCDVIDLDKIFE